MSLKTPTQLFIENFDISGYSTDGNGNSEVDTPPQQASDLGPF